MSTVTSKERNMLMITLVLVLYAAAFLFYRKQTENWKKHKRIYQGAREKYADECDLIAAKGEWDAKYTEMCSLMPVFPYEKDVDTHWLNIMDTVASLNRLSITRRQTGKEEEVGDVYELPLVCNNWEGTLESLVQFLYGLRKQGAMLDVRQLYVRPGSAPGYLKGTFTLYCAYMRGEVVEEPVSAGASAGTASPLPGTAVPETVADRPAPVAPPLEGQAEPAAVADPAGMPLPDTAVKEKPAGAGRPFRRTDNGGLRKESGGEVGTERGEVNEEEAVKAALEALGKSAGGRNAAPAPEAE